VLPLRQEAVSSPCSDGTFAKLNAVALFSAPFLPEPCEINDDDLARLSPLQHEHIKMLGIFHSALPDELAAGQRHALRTNDDRRA
jgi:hypothetical protein